MHAPSHLFSRGSLAMPLAAVLFVLGGCAMTPPPSLPSPPLPERFACLRERGDLIVSAHRGGPDAAHAENTLAAYAALSAHGLTLAETDVRTTRDGVLMLSHDADLGRVSSLTGAIADHDWATISTARMRTRSGDLTDFSPTRLAQLLDATRDGPILQLDIKEGTRIDAVLDAVEAAGAAGRVIYLTYTDTDIAAIVRRQPEALVATVIPNLDALARIEEIGIAPRQLHALFFESAIDRAFFAELRKREVTVLVAATSAEETGAHESHPLPAARYRAIRDAGAQILVSDHPIEAAAALASKGC